MMTNDAYLDRPLLSGFHATYEEGACLLEAVAHVAGLPHSGAPVCTCPVLAAFGRTLNDAIDDDTTRTRLLAPLVPKLLDTRSTPEVERRRAYIAADWVIREIVPMWLDVHPELTEHATALRALPEIVDPATAEAARAALYATTNAAAACPGANVVTSTADSAAYAAAYAATAAFAASLACAAACAQARLGAVALQTWQSAVLCLERMINVHGAVSQGERT
jgi:hypothetical protein